MKKSMFFSVIAFSMLLFSACEPATKQQPDMAQIKSDIQDFENDWAAAMNAKDIDGLMAMYADDAVSMSNDGPSLVGKTAIRKSQEQYFVDRPSGMNYAFETLDVYSAGDKVTEIGKSTIKDATGKVTLTGKYAVVFEKRDGKFVCLREIYNYDRPSAAAPALTKSVHLFDLPSGVTESAWSKALREMNAVIAGLGYPGAGYFLYKTEDAGTKDYRYYFEGIWPSDEAYTKIHEAPAFIEASKTVGALYDKIKKVEMYRRVRRVE